MNEERIIAIETKLAHQEQMLIELNDALANQQDSIITLERLCASIAERLRALDDGDSSSPPDDERPPHF
jgi:SlyX protein